MNANQLNAATYRKEIVDPDKLIHNFCIKLQGKRERGELPLLLLPGAHLHQSTFFRRGSVNKKEWGSLILFFLRGHAVRGRGRALGGKQARSPLFFLSESCTYGRREKSRVDKMWYSGATSLSPSGSPKMGLDGAHCSRIWGLHQLLSFLPIIVRKKIKRNHFPVSYHR